MTNLSIIIPTYNGAKQLEALLEKLSCQTVRSAELLVVDSASSDNTVEIARKFTDNLLKTTPEQFDHGGTRTLAAKMANGDILVFMTQDALPADEHAVENLIRAFEDEKVAAAYGRQLSYDDTNLFGKHLRLFNYNDSSYVRNLADAPKYGIKTAFLSNSFAAYRKSALAEVGYFKDGLILGEDTYAGAKLLLAGYALAYVSEARVFHSHSYSVWQEFKRYFDIGVFHKRENWILKEFGKAEGEGFKYVWSELKYLFANGGWYLLPEFFFRNFMKYSGYKLGQYYEKLPMTLVKKLSMHHSWWQKQR